MSYRLTPRVNLPLKKYDSISSNMGAISTFDGKEWGMHLGVDFDVQAGTQVFAIGRGRVVYAAMHPGKLKEDGTIEKRNWGGIVIIAHKHPLIKKVFYSLYGHVGKCLVKKGDAVEEDTVVGVIAPAMTEANGLWETEHLHFAIYTGPFKGRVLPGYFRKENFATEIEHWKEPLEFIEKYAS